MNRGHFYYIKDQYFIDFPDPHLMKNKETIDCQPHDRPCFYAFLDTATKLYWMIPFSSQVDKFQKIYNTKIDKYGKCDTILFGDVLGYEKAFLIQNMCPVSILYIKNEYVDGIYKKPVRVDGWFERELQKKARKVLALQRKGIRLIFPNVLEIERLLLLNK